ncbi:hypothetical protein GCM10010512_51670 [Streptomyces thermoviolaceus subsp. thermoviolaceus]|nr:hypothetical protein GCM10010512_51670 [Streptomyces thermoviolaceus subsp. thermoviolaceus]
MAPVARASRLPVEVPDVRGRLTPRGCFLSSKVVRSIVICSEYRTMLAVNDMFTAVCASPVAHAGDGGSHDWDATASWADDTSWVVASPWS